MKNSALIAAMLAVHPLNATASMQDYLWENRPILVFAKEGDPRVARQLALFDEYRSDLDERRNLVIVESDPGSDIWKSYNPRGFTVILIGLDGGEKFRSAEVTDPGTFSALIDTMPMRLNELRRKSTN